MQRQKKYDKNPIKRCKYCPKLFSTNDTRLTHHKKCEIGKSTNYLYWEEILEMISTNRNLYSDRSEVASHIVEVLEVSVEGKFSILADTKLNNDQNANSKEEEKDLLSELQNMEKQVIQLRSENEELQTIISKDQRKAAGLLRRIDITEYEKTNLLKKVHDSEIKIKNQRDEINLLKANKSLKNMK